MRGRASTGSKNGWLGKNSGSDANNTGPNWAQAGNEKRKYHASIRFIEIIKVVGWKAADDIFFALPPKTESPSLRASLNPPFIAHEADDGDVVVLTPFRSLSAAWFSACPGKGPAPAKGFFVQDPAARNSLWIWFDSHRSNRLRPLQTGPAYYVEIPSELRAQLKTQNPIRCGLAWPAGPIFAMAQCRRRRGRRVGGAGKSLAT